EDLGETFVTDIRLNNDKPANSSNGFDQLTPAVAINQWLKWIVISFDTPFGRAQGEVLVPVTTMHIVWQDFRNSSGPGVNDDPDIYYTTITVEPDGEYPWPVVFHQGGQEQVNDNDLRSWQSEPVWQSDPDVAATSSGLVLADSESYNAFVTWADWRNYGGEFDNVDIYFRLFSSVGKPTEFVGGNNVVVNDHARLHDFDVNTYEDYRLDVPPHARQRHPSVASTLIADWPTIFGGYVYVVWDDDRISDPFVDRNVYLARSNMLFGGHRRDYTAPSGAPPDTPGQGERYGSGAFVSEIFDSGSRWTRWYIIDWHAVTDDGTYITLQTRMGNSRAEVLASDWYPKRFPYPDDPDSQWKGAPLQGYDAPGQHIQDAVGNTCPKNCPENQYIQYRVNFWGRDTEPDPQVVELHTPFLFDVILHYETHILYLPIVYRDS
ncbi:MAG: hypothetical protein PVH17_09815, partial [Anaerolineae bacterium]